MPAPGNQHTSNIANPFEGSENRISEYTATQIATLQSRLEKQLGPEYISSRSGPSGQKVHYITAEKCIQLANEVFGFNGWSSSIQNIQVDFVEEHPQTLKVSLGLSVIVRVTLRDGTYHEDIGYGHMENCKGKAAAFEKAKKEGTTDALKRALRNFGNVLGNCIYDKAYLAKVSKMKVEPTKFDEQNLHRHSDFTRTETIKKEAAAAEAAKKANEESQDSYDDIFAEFDEVDFSVADDDGHPDEVVLTDADRSTLPENRVQNQPAPPAAAAMQPPTRPMARTASEGSTYRNRSGAPQTPNQQQAPRQNQFTGGAQFNGGHNQPNNQAQRPPAQQSNQNRQQPQQNNGGAGNHVNRHQAQQNNTGYNNNNNNNRSNGYNNTNSGTTTQTNTTSSGSSNQTPQPPTNPNPPPPPPPQAIPEGTTVGFFSARAVKEIPEDKLATGAVLAPQPAMAFNPRADSPSIRKTPGIDHTKSKPVGRGLTHIQPKPTSTQEAAVGGTGGSGGARPAPARPANVVNPQFDTARRIGAPGGPGSPLANRGQYRPPTVLKRPTPGDSGAVGGGMGPGRAPLSDVSNNVGGVATMGGGGGTSTEPEVKRQKLG